MGRPSEEVGSRDGTTFAFLASPAELAERLSTDLQQGLNDAEVQKRLKEHGTNALTGGGGVSPFNIFARQCGNAMTAVLYICMAVSGGIQSWIEFGVLGAIVVINIVSGPSFMADAPILIRCRSLKS